MHLSIILFYTYLTVFSTEAGTAVAMQKTQVSEFRIGVILDYGSRTGKEQITAIKMAIDDYYKYSTNKPVLHIEDSGQGPESMTNSVTKLINESQVHLVLVSMLDELDFISELGSKAQVPILSLADTVPPWVFKKWPFLIQATHHNYKQMKAVAAIVGASQWRSVNLIFEDSNSARSSVFPHLVDALNEVGSKIENFLAIPLFDVSLLNELQKLVHEQSRVFIVHTSLSVANSLFNEAKNMGLMERESVWIVTNSIADLLDTVNASTTSKMQGVLGVKTYFPQNTTRLNSFKSRFWRKFRSDYPEEEFSHSGVFALQAYDAAWAVTQALEGRTMNESVDKGELLYGKDLLDKISRGRFDGLGGEFKITEGELSPSRIFNIINVFGKSYRQLGQWIDGQGFSLIFNNRKDVKMQTLQHVLWPGEQWQAPRGWALPTSENTLKIGVPDNPESYVWINVAPNPGGKPTINGFCIDVFQAILNYLPYYLTYEFIPDNGTYDSLVEHVFDKRYDAVVGDTAIIAVRSKNVEFSQPWSDSGLQMVVSQKSVGSGKAWLFSKPYSRWMWILTSGITIFNGLIIWLMEKNYHEEFNGSHWNKVGSLVWLGFTSFFSLHGDRLRNNLTRVVMAAWFFVAIIIVQCYTASLSSILTVPHFRTHNITVESLRMSNAKVGCDERSFVVNYLQNVLNFSPENIKGFSSKDDYVQALSSGEIKAVFLEVPYVKVFLAKYCNQFTVIGETFNVGGFGLVFPRGSPMLPHINRAILQVKEHGKLQELEESLINAYNCSDSAIADQGSLGVNCFWGLFVVTGGTSTVALIIHLLRRFGPRDSMYDEIVEHNPESPRTDVMSHNGPHIPATTEDSGPDQREYDDVHATNNGRGENVLSIDTTNEDEHIHLEEQNTHPQA